MDKVELFKRKNYLLEYNDEFPLEMISTEDYFERLFYRKDEIHLQALGEEHYYDKHYNCIIMSLQKNDKGKKIGMNYIITKDLYLPDYIWGGEMVITSPLTYVGRNRNSNNARLCYGIAIDIDGVGEKQLIDVLHQQKIDFIPQANIIVNSGTGIHLYYLFAEPIALFDESKKLLDKLKHNLTEGCWNMYTSSYKEKQIQGIFQGFRIPGSKTKFGEPVACFARREEDLPLYRIRELASKYGLERLRLSEDEIDRLEKARYFPKKLSLDKAKELYPDWYERRVVRGQPRGRWHVKRDLYDWWVRRLREGGEVKEGHRYFCMMAMATYALKCDVPYNELKEDAYSLIEDFEGLTKNEDNHFTPEDVEDALHAYKECYATFPRDTISKITGLLMIPNKRNYRTQADHLRRARAVQLVDYPDREWINKAGRAVGSTISADKSPKAEIVRAWRGKHPEGNKYQCEMETGLSRKTVRKWWG